MVNNIEYLLGRIHLNIPEEILNVAFKPYTQNGLRSLDSVMQELIIFKIVLTDCNLFSGKIKSIPLKLEYAKDVEVDDPYLIGKYYLYVIPAEARDFQNITYCLDVSYPVYVYGDETFNASPKSLYAEASEILTSHTGVNQFVKPMATVLKNNTIKLNPPQLVHFDWIVECILSYNKSFDNIAPAVLRSLSEMCTYACQMFIYSKLIIKIDKGLLIGGKELGKFKEIVEEYKDSKEKYSESLKSFRGSSQFDKDTMIEWISLMV